MGVAVIAKLAEKVRLVVVELHGLRKENERLATELALVQEENRRARRLIREHEELKAEKARLRGRLEKVFSKLDKMKL